MSKDFTLEKFSKLCESIIENYNTITIENYLSMEHKPEKFVIMRHDVDRRPGNALKTAKIENALGIHATYFFRTNNDVFIPDIIRTIKDMGHEIGYHYEVLTKTKGNYEMSIELFEKELLRFREICDVNTICMHGAPLSKYDNRDLWKTYDFKNFGILGEAYLSVKNINYFSDTGRWNIKNNIRDFVPHHELYDTRNTDDLIELITNNKFNSLYILTHPERWSSNYIEWQKYYLIDFISNFGKKILKMKSRRIKK